MLAFPGVHEKGSTGGFTAIEKDIKAFRKKDSIYQLGSQIHFTTNIGKTIFDIFFLYIHPFKHYTRLAQEDATIVQFTSAISTKGV